ncbi:hypothetical protein MNBD_UNCLBAC01-1492 [hydrothermal vent metagenome]|uniref:Alkaline shock response membrane anchor protein AmaP n=1 Tax=hydrothermal vent metagenome TaxID=652676 RepID=A0A3B1DNZ4_9ZZZZ
MSFLKRVVILCYVTLGLFTGSFFLLAFLNFLDVRSMMEIFYAVSFAENLKLVTGIIAVVLLFINFIFYSVFSTGRKRENALAFDNPDGRVNVSLGALEDIIKRLTGRLSEVKDSKLNITISKKGLKVKVNMVVASEVSIPGLTSRVQDLIKKKIQDAIGLEEEIEVEIFVNKILPDQGREKVQSDKQETQDVSEPGIPFHGYRA